MTLSPEFIRALLIAVAAALLVGGVGMLLWGAMQIGLGQVPQAAVSLIVGTTLLVFHHIVPRPS
jgi:hypothetical protein